MTMPRQGELVVNPVAERFRRRSFIVFAFLVAALGIGVLETKEPARILPNVEDLAAIKAAAAAWSMRAPMWAIVCADRDSAVSETARLERLTENRNYAPTAQEAVVGGCSWNAFTVQFPLMDSDLPTMLNPAPIEARWYRGNMTFKSGPWLGETLRDAYIKLDTGTGATLLRSDSAPRLIRLEATMTWWQKLKLRIFLAFTRGMRRVGLL